MLSGSKYNCIVLLKVPLPFCRAGGKVYINASGNAGIAKGSGDVLTGMITLYVGISPFEAMSRLYIHDRAGEKQPDALRNRHDSRRSDRCHSRNLSFLIPCIKGDARYYIEDFFSSCRIY